MQILFDGQNISIKSTLGFVSGANLFLYALAMYLIETADEIVSDKIHLGVRKVTFKHTIEEDGVSCVQSSVPGQGEKR